MRLSKYLSLSVAMSVNQANFFIRKGRLSVDGTVIKDPHFEVADDSQVAFDSNPISIAQYQYVVINKPASYACRTTDTEHQSVLELMKNRSEGRFYYFANTLAPEVTGLVLVSDDARWTSRLKRRLIKKSRVYRVQSKNIITDDLLQKIKTASLVDSEDKSPSVTRIERHNENTLHLTAGNVDLQDITTVLSSLGLIIETLHLHQIGRLSLEDLPEGDCLALTEKQVIV